LFVNILAHADDTIILAPSWNAMQVLLKFLELQHRELDTTCNTKSRLDEPNFMFRLIFNDMYCTELQ